MKKGLFALALGTFTLGIAEFIIEGIITDIAHNMNVSIPEAGHLISIYALGVCAGAFSLILMHKYRPKNILMFLASLIRILKLSSDSQNGIEPAPFYSWWDATDCRADSAVAPVAHEISPDHRF